MSATRPLRPKPVEGPPYPSPGSVGVEGPPYPSSGSVGVGLTYAQGPQVTYENIFSIFRALHNEIYHVIPTRVSVHK